MALAPAVRANDGLRITPRHYVAYPNEEDCTLSVSVNGGSGKYSYSWEGGGSAASITLNAPASGEISKKCTVTDTVTGRSDNGVAKLTVFSVKEITADKTAIVKDGAEHITLTAVLTPSAPRNTPGGGLLEWQRSIGSENFATLPQSTEATLVLAQNADHSPNRYRFRARPTGSTDAGQFKYSANCYVLTMGNVSSPASGSKQTAGMRGNGAIRGPKIIFFPNPQSASAGLKESAVLCQGEISFGDKRCTTDEDFEEGTYIKMLQLPANNSAWGDNTITLRIIRRSDKAILVSEDVSVKVYFYPEEQTNPGCQAVPRQFDPSNWLYYWRNGNVVDGLSGVVYDRDSKYRGYHDKGVIALTKQTRGGATYSHTFQNRYYMAHITTGPDGICQTTKAGDDVQRIGKNKGEPNVMCIKAGASGVLYSQPRGDDQCCQNNTAIHTGANGVCETQLDARDVRVNGILQGKGLPYSICITAGPDNYLESADYPSGDLRHDPGDTWVYNQNVTITLREDTSGTGKGIYAVATTLAHEEEHKRIYELRKNNKKDSDGDLLPDVLEGCPPYYFFKLRKDTYNIAPVFDANEYQGYADNECMARKAQDQPKAVQPAKDWSYEGYNWYKSNN